MYRANVTPRVAKDVLHKTSTVQAGKLKPHMRRPFADPEVLALLEYLATIDVTADKFEHFFARIEAYLKASEQKALSEVSEESKFNLVIASDLGDDLKERGSIFEVA